MLEALASGLIGGIMTSFGQEQKLQKDRELMGVQHRNNEISANNQFERNKKMWDYTNFENQMKHIKAAGLSPALIYGQTGAGGASVGGSGLPTNSISNTEAPNYMASLAQTLETKRVENETKVADTQAAKNQAEADRAAADAEKLKQDTETSASQEELNRSQAKLNDIDRRLKEMEEKENIPLLKANKLAAEAREAQMNANYLNMKGQSEEKRLNKLDEILDMQLKAMRQNMLLQKSQMYELMGRVQWYKEQASIGHENAKTAAGQLLATWKKIDQDLEIKKLELERVDKGLDIKEKELKLKGIVEARNTVQMIIQDMLKIYEINMNMGETIIENISPM